MDYKIIKLTKNKETLINDEDYTYLSQFKWQLSSEGYAQRVTSRKLGKRKSIQMHREIMNCSTGKEIDHINGNRLDNRKENLRICTSQQNQFNLKRRINNTSGYKGVSWHKKDKKWRARIKADNKYIFLGNFDSKNKAAKAYDTAAKQYFGEYARLNYA